MKAYRWPLLVLTAIQFTHIMDFMIIMPLGPQLMRVFGISPQQFGFLVSVYTFAAGIAGLAASLFVDRFDRKQVLLTAYLGFVMATVACGLANSYEMLLVARTITGLFGGVLAGTVLAVIGDLVPQARRASAMGLVMTGFALASVFGVPFGLLLASLFTWHSPFFFLGGASALVFIAIWLVIPRLASHIQLDASIRRTLLNNVRFLKHVNTRWALLLTMLLLLGQFSIIPFISPYMVFNVGFTEHELTFIYLLGGAVTIVVSPLVGRLADRYGRSLIFSIFTLLSLVPLAVITNLPQTPITIALIVTTSFFIVISGRMVPGITLITSSVDPKQRGAFMSVNGAVQQFTASIASLSAGLIIFRDTAGMLHRFWMVGLFAMVCSVLAAWVAQHIKEVAPTE
jgi:predicted MFS family arabinose efflux permease